MMRSMVPMMDTLSPDHTMRLGASLRDRATLPSPLRGLGPSGGYPSRLRSLRSLRAPLARRLAPLTAVAGPPPLRRGSTAASSSRRRFAPRLSRCSPRSPWPAAPAAGCAWTRHRSTPCAAGVGFAVHRLAHRVVQSCPHQCGLLRRRLRQRAAHDCLRLRPHRPPLTRDCESIAARADRDSVRVLALPGHVIFVGNRNDRR